jgi:uncharacterized membrane protein
VARHLDRVRTRGGVRVTRFDEIALLLSIACISILGLISFVQREWSMVCVCTLAALFGACLHHVVFGGRRG